MKKSILLIAVLILPLVSFSQYNYYHGQEIEINDTVVFKLDIEDGYTIIFENIKEIGIDDEDMIPSGMDKQDAWTINHRNLIYQSNDQILDAFWSVDTLGFIYSFSMRDKDISLMFNFNNDGRIVKLMLFVPKSMAQYFPPEVFGKLYIAIREKIRLVVSDPRLNYYLASQIFNMKKIGRREQVHHDGYYAE